MLSPYGEVGTPGPFLDLALASFAEFPAFVDLVEKETGARVRYAASGKIEIAYTRDRARHLRQQAKWLAQVGANARPLEHEELADLEPSIAMGGVQGALLFPEDAHVDSRALTFSVAQAAARAGVRIAEETPVVEIVTNAGSCSGVRTPGGTTHASDLVVLAAGSAVGAIRGIPRSLGVGPMLGQMIAYRASGQLSQMVHTEDVYLVQRGSRLLVGATMEPDEPVARITEAARQVLAKGARTVLPNLPDQPYEQWSGLRPTTRDGLPVLGMDPELPGLAYACGHFRSGILLAPAMADWAPVLIGQPPSSGRLLSIDWSAFRAGR